MTLGKPRTDCIWFCAVVGCAGTDRCVWDRCCTIRIAFEIYRSLFRAEIEIIFRSVYQYDSLVEHKQNLECCEKRTAICQTWVPNVVLEAVLILNPTTMSLFRLR